MSGEKPSALRFWLARYKPEVIRCHLADGKGVSEIKRPTIARGQWAHLEHAILNLTPAYIEAVRGGEVVASKPLDFEDDETEEKEERNLAQISSPEIASLVKAFPTIAQLFVDVGDASAARHQEAYAMAFREMTAVVKMTTDMASGLAKAWMQMMFERSQAAAAAGGDNDEAAVALLGKLLEHEKKPASASASASEATNGKKK
jgi:hypothetical protein